MVIAQALLATILWLTSPPSQAEDAWVVATLTSYHFNRDRNYNEHNFGLGVEVQHTPEIWSSFGFYKNSYNKETMYLFSTWVPARVGEIRFGASVGIVTGYEHYPAWVLLPVATWDNGKWGTNVALTPSFIGLQMKFRIE